jgi:hypothetical protein
MNAHRRRHAFPIPITSAPYRRPAKIDTMLKIPGEPSMDRRFGFCAAMVATLLARLASHGASAQEEFPPPQDKGRVVVVASGASGLTAYRDVARRIAALGYDVVAFDSNAWKNTQGAGLRCLRGLADRARLVDQAAAYGDAFAKTEAALKRNMN